MKTLWILVLIYSGHPGHPDGAQGPRQGAATTRQECEELAAKLTFMIQHPGGKWSGTYDRIECRQIKR